MFEIDGSSLTLEQVQAAAATPGANVRLADTARERMLAGRARVDEIVESGETVYGVNTGFGHFAEISIPADSVRQLQLNLVRSHAVGTGELLSPEVVRALLVLRANVMAHGCSGVRPAVADQMLGLLRADALPVVPRQGSVGASGDLAPLAHLALVLIGEGEAFVGGERTSGAAALEAAGLTPLDLQPKEGLALVNGTQVMTALGTLASAQLDRLCSVANVTGAMSLEALLGKTAPFDPAIAELRGFEGQRRCADEIRALLSGSQLADSEATRVQDGYSLRCMPQVHGAAYDVCAMARTTFATELNAVTDNPVVLPDGRVLSCGNFHGQPIAYALDFLAMAATDLASIAERRINRLLNPRLSGLPAFLVEDGGLRSGYLMVQTSAAAIVAENRTLAVPASTDSVPTSADQEDHVSMGTWGGWKAGLAVENCRRVLAMELLCAAEAMEFRDRPRQASALGGAHTWVRERVARLDTDRPLTADIGRIAAALSDDGLLTAAGIR
ncbi:MAG: histidine ammonia-lyase [Acidobacteria bacterium]|nr:histidine ammonia-lyase [Acidobacteriota bacterium]